MKPICVPCRRFYRMVRAGLPFIEGMPSGNDAPAGNKAPDRWRPYKVWFGDLWRCPDCGAEIISGVGSQRVAEHYEADFKDWADRAEGLQINDC